MASTDALLTVNDFHRQINCGKTAGSRQWRRYSVERVLSDFEQVQSNMCPAALRETFNFLLAGRWINDARKPSSHPSYKAIRGCAALGPDLHQRYYPDLLVIKAIWPSSRSVEKLVDDFERHWGVALHDGGAVYPEGADPAREYALFSSGEVDKCQHCGTRWCVCHPKMLKAGEDPDEFESASIRDPWPHVDADPDEVEHPSDWGVLPSIEPSPNDDLYGKKNPAARFGSGYSTSSTSHSPNQYATSKPPKLRPANTYKSAEKTRSGKPITQPSHVSSYRSQVDCSNPMSPSLSRSRSRDVARAPDHMSPATYPVKTNHPHDHRRSQSFIQARLKAHRHPRETNWSGDDQRPIKSGGGRQEGTDSKPPERPMHYMSAENDFQGWYMSPVDRKRKLVVASDSEDGRVRRVKREY
ncbi:hypothetical protein ACJ41O_000294 [Fusarium nematophilum]